MSAAIAITGIHTGIGKTMASMLVTEALGADYWKPVQAGSFPETDADKVRQLVSHSITVHPEAFILKEPISPHAAAKAEGTSIYMKHVRIPQTNNILIIETAGGVLTPFDADYTMGDFLMHYKIPTILVVKHYLGSINHTIASIEAIHKREIRLFGMIVNGDADKASEDFIQNYTGIDILARIPWMSAVTPHAVAENSAHIREQLKTTLSKWIV